MWNYQLKFQFCCLKWTASFDHQMLDICGEENMKSLREIPMLIHLDLPPMITVLSVLLWRSFFKVNLLFVSCSFFTFWRKRYCPSVPVFLIISGSALLFLGNFGPCFQGDLILLFYFPFQIQPVWQSSSVQLPLLKVTPQRCIAMLLVTLCLILHGSNQAKLYPTVRGSSL